MLKDKIKLQNFKRNHILFRNEKENTERVFNEFEEETHFKNYDFDFNPIVDNLYVQDMWVVRYQQGDYNYFHTHPNAVLSSALFLEVPPQIHHEKNFPDGYLALLGDTVYDENTLRFSKQAFIKPDVGKMIVFPASLGHQVYPFKGEGTRKVISVNWGRNYQEKIKRS